MILLDLPLAQNHDLLDEGMKVFLCLTILGEQYFHHPTNELRPFFDVDLFILWKYFNNLRLQFLFSFNFFHMQIRLIFRVLVDTALGVKRDVNIGERFFNIQRGQITKEVIALFSFYIELFAIEGRLWHWIFFGWVLHISWERLSWIGRPVYWREGIETVILGKLEANIYRSV